MNLLSHIDNFFPNLSVACIIVIIMLGTVCSKWATWTYATVYLFLVLHVFFGIKSIFESNHCNFVQLKSISTNTNSQLISMLSSIVWFESQVLTASWSDIDQSIQSSKNRLKFQMFNRFRCHTTCCYICFAQLDLQFIRIFFVILWIFSIRNVPTS